MDFNERLDKLEQRVQQAKASATAAASENHTQVMQRLDQAQAEIDDTLSGPRQVAADAAQGAQDRWDHQRADAKAHVEALKAKAHLRVDQADAAFAVTDANMAASDAYDAIDFADWAVESARLAILDAIDARAYADEKAALAR